MKALASEIRQTADESGWSLNHICEQVGISPVQLFQWEHGTKARPKTAKKVRKGLKEFGIVPTAEGFTSSKVSEGVAKKNADETMMIVAMITQADVDDETKLEAIRFLLSK